MVAFLLRTAFSVSGYKNHNSPVSSGAARLNQYELGLKTLSEKIPFFESVEKLLVDNTVDAISQLPESYRSLENTRILLTKSNKYGVLNKGAGDIETFQFLYKRGMIENSFYFFYEPRMRLDDPTFIIDFFSKPRNIICAPDGVVGVRSGYYGFHGSQFKGFVDKQKPRKMVRKNISIETELLEFAMKEKWEINKNGGYCSRFDPAVNCYESY